MITTHEAGLTTACRWASGSGRQAIMLSTGKSKLFDGIVNVF